MRVVPPNGGSSENFQMPEIQTHQIKRFIAILLILFLIVVAIQMKPWFTVGPDEQAIVLRFGQLNRIVGSGFRFKIPVIESVFIENVTEIKRVEVGFSTQGGRYIKDDKEALMVTGDEALVHIEMSVQYRINDPFLFRFYARDAEMTMKDIAEAAIRQIVGDLEIDAVWTYGRERVQMAVRELMQSIVDSYQLGVSINQVQLQDVIPPEAVVDAFQQVQNASAQSEKIELEAQGYRERKMPQAEAEVATILRAAEAYRAEKIAKAKGDVDRFDLLLNQYRNAEEVTRKRLYLETLEKVLAGRKKLILEETGSTLPILNLTEAIDGK